MLGKFGEEFQRRELPADLRKRVAAVGITGQMHGVLLWQPGTTETSRLITWQDERCNEGEFLTRLHETAKDDRLRTGFGLASLAKPDIQVSITIGTGAQISVIVPELPSVLPPANSSYEYRPYIDNTFAIVAASLSGGSPAALLARTFQEMVAMLGYERPELGKVYEVLHREGLTHIDTTLRASPTIRGERHNPSIRGSITSISADNFTPGDLNAAICRGIVTNLCSMLPAESYNGRKEIVGSGNAIRRSALMKKVIETTFALPLILTEGKEEAAAGAALLAARLI